MGSHFKGGYVEGVNYLMSDVVLFGVVNVEHGCRSQD